MPGKLVSSSLALVVMTAGAIPAVGAAARQKPVRMKKADVFIDSNATDGDAALLIDLEGGPWRRMTVRAPSGRVVMDVTGDRYGLQSGSIQSVERLFKQVPLKQFKARFPAGRYTFTGTTIDGRRLIGSDRLTHTLPAAPVVRSPKEAEVVEPAAVVVRWDRVTKPTGVKIVGYDVIVTAEASGRELTAELGPAATSADIPASFLARGAEYAVEVLARERSGNSTVTEVPFKTTR
jgi:hypothetical protein